MLGALVAHVRTRKPAVEVTFVSLRMAVQFLDFDCSNTDPDSLYQKLHHKAVVVHRVKNPDSFRYVWNRLFHCHKADVRECNRALWPYVAR